MRSWKGERHESLFKVIKRWMFQRHLLHFLRLYTLQTLLSEQFCIFYRILEVLVGCPSIEIDLYRIVNILQWSFLDGHLYGESC